MITINKLKDSRLLIPIYNYSENPECYAGAAAVAEIDRKNMSRILEASKIIDEQASAFSDLPYGKYLEAFEKKLDEAMEHYTVTVEIFADPKNSCKTDMTYLRVHIPESPSRPERTEEVPLDEMSKSVLYDAVLVEAGFKNRSEFAQVLYDTTAYKLEYSKFVPSADSMDIYSCKSDAKGSCIHCDFQLSKETKAALLLQTDYLKNYTQYYDEGYTNLNQYEDNKGMLFSFSADIYKNNSANLYIFQKTISPDKVHLEDTMSVPLRKAEIESIKSAIDQYYFQNGTIAKNVKRQVEELQM